MALVPRYIRQQDRPEGPRFGPGALPRRALPARSISGHRRLPVLQASARSTAAASTGSRDLSRSLDGRADLFRRARRFRGGHFRRSQASFAFDGEGRIMLPDGADRACAASPTRVAFVGRGRTFEIWEPQRASKPITARRAAAPWQQGRAANAAGGTGDERARARHDRRHDARCCSPKCSRRWRRATAASMSTAPSAPAAIARAIAGGGRLPRARHRPRSRMRSPRATTLADRYPGRLTLIEGRFGDMDAPRRRARHGVGRRRRARSRRLLDAARRGRSAASPSAPTGRSTCAWAATARSAADLVNDAAAKRSSPTSSATLRRGAMRAPRSPAPSSPRARKRRSPRTARARRDRPRGVGPHAARRHRSGDAHLPGAAHRGQRRARRTRPRPRRRPSGC